MKIAVTREEEEEGNMEENEVTQKDERYKRGKDKEDENKQ